MIEMLLQADRLLTVDRVDQAEAIYRLVFESDPQNAIAVVGIARCALAREDDHEAYRLAVRALAIDPRNDMARRMEARLAEVLTTRGEVPGSAPGQAQVPAAESGAAGASAPWPGSAAAPSEPPVPVPESVPTRAPDDAPPTPSGRRSLIDRLRGR